MPALAKLQWRFPRKQRVSGRAGAQRLRGL